MTSSAKNISINRTTSPKEIGEFGEIEFGSFFSDHMFTMDYSPAEGWHKPQITPYQPITIYPSNITLNYAQSIFEGLKAYHDFQDPEQVFIFRLEDHVERLNRSVGRIAIPELPAEVVAAGIKLLIQIDSRWVPKSKTAQLYIRPLVVAMDTNIGIKVAKTYKLFVFTCIVGNFFKKPLHAKIETKYSRAAPGGTGYSKFSGNYGGSIYPRHLAIQEGYDELIWTDSCEHRYIEEAGTMNLMFATKNKIITPACGDTILTGITRKTLLTLAKDFNIEAEIRPILVDEIIEGIQNGTIQEAFGAGTAATVAPLAKITYKDKTYALPVLPKEQSIAQLLLEKLNTIRYGLAVDKYNWLTKIQRQY